MENLICPTRLDMAGAFLRLGMQGFGGQAALLSLLQRDLVERRGWLRAADIPEALTYTNLLPGSTNIQVVAYLGYKLRGLPGMLVATTAFLFPAVLIMLAFAVGYRFLRNVSGVPHALQGLTAAATGLMLSVAVGLFHKQVTTLLPFFFAAAAFVGSVRFGVNPAFLVGAAGLIGVVREAGRPQK